MQITYSLRLPREASTVPLVRKICGDTLGRLGVTPTCRHDVALALTEACANAVRHAEGTHGYRVDVRLNTGSCDISVVDTGPGIDADRPGEAAMPSPTDEGGRGIALMHRLMDSTDVGSSPTEGTVVHLRKDLDLEEGSVLKSLTDRLR